jgi:hypothetical protein
VKVNVGATAGAVAGLGAGAGAGPGAGAESLPKWRLEQKINVIERNRLFDSSVPKMIVFI